uniref:Predicted protein n=1 Tax=Hordeum vulgare subsp. vulgare TaxID=112509 RepID=F2D9I5_HORVV|nr:predicted protein [Hordeum vulgare subsp. vulgare]
MALAAKAEAPVRPVRLSARHSSTPRKDRCFPGCEGRRPYSGCVRRTQAEVPEGYRLLIDALAGQT